MHMHCTSLYCYLYTCFCEFQSQAAKLFLQLSVARQQGGKPPSKKTRKEASKKARKEAIKKPSEKASKEKGKQDKKASKQHMHRPISETGNLYPEIISIQFQSISK